MTGERFPWLRPPTVAIETRLRVRAYIDQHPGATYDESIALAPVVRFADSADRPPLNERPVAEVTVASAIENTLRRAEQDNPVSMRVYRLRTRIEAFQEVAETLREDYPEARALVEVMVRLSQSGLWYQMNGHPS